MNAMKTQAEQEMLMASLERKQVRAFAGPSRWSTPLPPLLGPLFTTAYASHPR